MSSSGSPLQFASGLSAAPSADAALGEAMEQLTDALDGPPDLVAAFVTAHHAPARSGVAERVAARWPGVCVVGGSAGGVLGAGREIEGKAGIALWGARLPGVELTPFHLDRALLGTPGDAASALEDALGDVDPAGLMVLSDPYTFDLGALLPSVMAVLPGVPVFGGQASGVRHPGPHELFLRDRTLHGGATGLALSGDLRVDTRVAQGCRPVGPPMFVTSCEDHVILELDGRRPGDVVREVFEALDGGDQARFRQSQLIGIQMRDQEEYGQGDFLVRHLLGVTQDGRGLAVAGQLERYAVVQLQVRDAISAHDDLVRSLRDLPPVDGALLFTCLGRGQALFGDADHDTRVFQERVGPVPLAGFFGNGELGPVHGQPHVHGYSAVFALFGRPIR
jgi:small ligand-binding sensory domain FIST